MALQGCCCCGLRGGAKAVGVLFLVITLMKLVGIVTTWAVLTVYQYPTNVQSIGVDTSEGKFGVKLRETQSVLGGRGEDATLSLGKFGTIGVSSDVFSSNGLVSRNRITHSVVYSNNGRVEGMPSNILICLICYTVYILLAVSFNSMLIHGTDHDSSCAVLAWLVFYGAMFVVMSLSSIGGLIAAMAIGSANVGVAASIGVGSGVGLLLCALLWFWWVLVLTFYRELRDGTRGFKYHRDVSLQEPPTPRAPHPATERKAEDYA